MTPEQIQAAVIRALLQVAPEASADEIDAAAPLQEQLDLDSMDFLQFLENLAAETGVEIPERDAGSLSTVNACVEYLGQRALGGGSASAFATRET